MTVSINRLEYKDAWVEMAKDNLKAGKNVALENFDYAKDLDKCFVLAREFKAKMFIDAEKTICHFLIPN